jgi:tetratricopeptide (TPR) repeat protein
MQQERGKACERFSQARTEVSAEYTPEITFELARCLEQLGRVQEAEEWYQQIPLSFDRAAEGVRSLVALALDRGDFQQAEFWISKGRELFPAAFMESWVALADARIAIGRNDSTAALAALTAAEARFPPSDPSLQLMRADVERFLWETRSSAQLASTGSEEGSR